MSSVRPPTVYLLRSGSQPDPYIEALERAGKNAVCVPVLAFEFPHQAELLRRLQRSAAYGGFIVTSPRAVLALRKAFEEAPELRSHWVDKRAYAVGPKTARALRELGCTPQGQKSGDAASLAAVIAKKKQPETLLFLSGNRRRDELPNALNEADVPFEELVVYETHTRRDIDIPDAQPNDWLVFFSPSGIEAVQATSSIDASSFRIAAIGTTTSAALEAAGLTVDAVAKYPTPEAVRRAIRNAPAVSSP